MVTRFVIHTITVIAVAVACLAASAETRDLKDARRGYYTDALVRESFTTLRDGELDVRVSRVANRVVEAAGNPHGYTFQFRVLNDPTPNAFAATAGYIYITSGLLEMLESEDELAAVLAHEVAHVNERHPAKIFAGSKKAVLTTVAIQAGAAVAAYYVGTQVSASMAGQVSNYDAWRTACLAADLTSLAVTQIGQRVLHNMHEGYEKGEEFEADRLAVSYLADAQYDSAALANVLQRLSEHDRSARARKFITYLHSSPKKLRLRLEELQAGRN